MRKKILVTAMMAVMAVQLAGCGKGQEETAEKPVEESEMIPAGLQDVDEAAATEEVLPEEAEEEEAGVQFVSWEEAGLEDHVMDWKDEALELEMQLLTGKISEEEIQEKRLMGEAVTCDEEIMLSDVWELTELSFGVNISDISALSELKNLTSLSFSGSEAVSDFSAVSELPNLTSLMLSGCGVSDISFLSGLTNLTGLALQRNSISDISSLSGLTNLVALDLQGNSISDISSLSGLKNLEYLNVTANSITDFSVVTELPNLCSIDYDMNPIEDMSPLEEWQEAHGW